MANGTMPFDHIRDWTRYCLTPPKGRAGARPLDFQLGRGQRRPAVEGGRGGARRRTRAGDPSSAVISGAGGQHVRCVHALGAPHGGRDVQLRWAAGWEEAPLDLPGEERALRCREPSWGRSRVPLGREAVAEHEVSAVAGRACRCRRRLVGRDWRRVLECGVRRGGGRRVALPSAP
jgi:hypothetical protein